MNDTQREALNVLAELWSMSPEVRLGQLMSHLGFMGECHLGKSLAYIDDDELVAILYRHREELRARATGSSVFDSHSTTSVSGSPTVAEITPPLSR